MDLDSKICSRARLSRDARFDGKFFIGVLSTGIYCRSICRARTAKESNVRYFPSAAAAAEAGFRPCLRCRPECSPGTPGWLGTPSTVARALRLIDESSLDESAGQDSGVESLAERLGLGSRHLRRLFLRHLGATPSAVVRTRRLHFAKKLIDETSLPMNQVASASGFGSVRRFNAAIRKTYHRTPSQIRRIAKQTEAPPRNQYLFRLGFRPPYDWSAMLAFLAPRMIPGVEVLHLGRYRRSIVLNGEQGYFDVSLDQKNNALDVCIQFGDPRSLFFIIERIRAMFDLNADSREIVRCLGSDPLLARRVEAAPGLRVPGCWNGFELAVRAILGQQISVKAATTLAGRIATTFGRRFSAASGLTHLFPTPQTLADANLAGIGLPTARAKTVQALARAVHDGQIRFEGIVEADSFLTQLCQIPGIGTWTAQYVAMRALGEPDAFPSSDLGLRYAAGLDSPRALQERAEAWRPWRSYAAMYLWTNPGVHSELRTSPPKEAASRRDRSLAS
jgi:AraC family transcriptional regulator of adaptative response / DNA-3-methyladenine glycosylase II